MWKLQPTQEWTTRPAPREIFGHFIESGFGRQAPGMWSEMLFNRAFREVPPYYIATWEWLGIDQEHYNENAPFWHSGYEEHDWEFIGPVKIKRLIGDHTYKGTTALCVTNPEEGTVCGVKQEGLHLQKGRKYRFELMACAQGSISEAGLDGFGDNSYAEELKPVKITIAGQEHIMEVNTLTKEQEWVFEAQETEVAALSITFDWQGAVVFSCASLMPADNMNGWRRDVVEQMRKIAPPVIRFPGGCFVSFYRWQSSIGPRNTRDPMPSYYWGGLEENDVGLDEFMQLSEYTGFKPQICINMMTSFPFDARQLVEYLNAPENVGMGRLRMINGHAVPYGVRYFEMDNEPNRKWSASQYAQACVDFVEEMRQADPSIEPMMACYGYPLEALPMMLDIAGGHIKYVIYRQGYPAFVKKALEVIRAYNAETGRDVQLVNTEWLSPCASIEPFEDSEMPCNFRWRGKVTNDYRNILSTHQISWNYALNGAARLLDYMSYGGEFALANFNNFCNTWGQNVIEATKDESYLSNMGEIFHFFNRHYAPCYAQKPDIMEGDGREGVIDALMTRDLEGIEKLYLINHSAKPQEVVLPEGEWACDEALYGDGRMYGAKVDAPVAHGYAPEMAGGTIQMKGLSLCCLRRVK